MTPHLALVVDADPVVRDFVGATLASERLQVLSARGTPEALDFLGSRPISLLLVHPEVAGGDLARFLAEATRPRPGLVCLALDDQAGTRAADLYRAGFFDVLARPPDPPRLKVAAERALNQAALLGELARVRAVRHDPVPPFVGRSEPISIVRERLSSAAAGEGAVLLIGEPGTGKHLAARTLHALSARRAGPFVAVDGSPRAGPEGGAKRDAREWFDAALGGLLYLENVHCLPGVVQEKLLERLAEGSGSARVVSAAAAGLEEWVRAGTFHAELADALSVWKISLVPLRERGRDIVLLARHFVETICRMNLLSPVAISVDAVSVLERYPWPGNVDELREVVERALTLASRGVIRAENLPEKIRREAGAMVLAGRGETPRRFHDAKRRVVESFERGYLEDLMAWTRGNVTVAAGQAGMLRSALQRLLRKHELRSSEFRRASLGIGSRRDDA